LNWVQGGRYTSKRGKVHPQKCAKEKETVLHPLLSREKKNTGYSRERASQRRTQEKRQSSSLGGLAVDKRDEYLPHKKREKKHQKNPEGNLLLPEHWFGTNKCTVKKKPTRRDGGGEIRSFQGVVEDEVVFCKRGGGKKVRSILKKRASSVTKELEKNSYTSQIVDTGKLLVDANI